MDADPQSVQVRNRQYQVISTTLMGLAALICLVQIFRPSEGGLRFFYGALGFILLYPATRGPTSATVLVRGDRLIVKNLIRTRRVPASSIDRLVTEVGLVNLYRRVYPRLILKNGTSSRLTALNRRPSESEKVEQWVSELNHALGIQA